MLNTFNSSIVKKAVSKKNVMNYISFMAIFILVLVFTAMDSSFVNKANLKNLLSDTAPLMIMAAGMTFVILLASIDLSTGAICSVANVLVVKFLASSVRSSETFTWQPSCPLSWLWSSELLPD